MVTFYALSTADVYICQHDVAHMWDQCKRPALGVGIGNFQDIVLDLDISANYVLHRPSITFQSSTHMK